MLVRELIALLQSLPEDQKDSIVRCSYDAECASTEIYGINEDYNWPDEDTGKKVIMLQGD